MYVRVHVVPDARKEKVMRRGETEFDMLVKEPAARNLANRRVRELLAAQFGVAVEAVRIVTGHRSPTKVFSIGD